MHPYHQGWELTFDFSETDAQVTGMINSYYHQNHSNTLCTTFLFLGKALSAYHTRAACVRYTW
jgi:hypothetical protein